jgi:hypothetical protein
MLPLKKFLEWFAALPWAELIVAVLAGLILKAIGVA